ncbi:MAG TPA: sodium:solute symporter family protein [Victivallales bacterium]|nr:sodium:solute symporter family protein [Victivallales bacterium]
MHVSYIDISIIVAYFIITVSVGFIVSKRARKNLNSYFLSNKKLPWYILGISDASGMFDIAGTMWMVSNAFVYGVLGIYMTWIWPVFNQIFNMVFMSAWVRRSDVLTGAEWMKTRYGTTRMAEATNILIVVFAIIAAIGYYAYAFAGIGEFAATFFPWNLEFSLIGFQVESFQTYAIIITFVSGLYAVKGGMPSVVTTEVIQFFVMTTACILVAIVAMNSVTNAQIMALVPEGWDSMMIHWKMNLNWKNLIPEVSKLMPKQGYSFFGVIVMLMLFKGLLSSVAGPIPSYDMQRMLATKNPIEASKMSGVVSAVLLIPRYLMITGLTVLAIVYLSPHIRTESGMNFEQILPLSIKYCMPVGIAGILLAGLIAAFMSTFTANVNAPPAYIVNDIYKKYIKPNMPAHHYVKASYIASLAMLIVGILAGLYLKSINAGMQWLFAGLFGGYAAPNVLKWTWWRFNCSGYFWGMICGMLSSFIVPFAFPGLSALYGFPIILAVALIGCLIGTLCAQPDDEKVLMSFYKTVRPWGFWGPVRKKLTKMENLVIKTHFRRDMFNCLIGVIWQTSLMALGTYIVIKEYNKMYICIAIIVICSIILKFNWWNKLEN